ncbi:MAG: hypothetical protein V8R64_08380 [Thomasclavelia sp.]
MSIRKTIHHIPFYNGQTPVNVFMNDSHMIKRIDRQQLEKYSIKHSLPSHQSRND